MGNKVSGPEQSQPSPRGASPVQSVDRAVTILELLARRTDAGITEIAAELGVHKSTASRLAAALEMRGLIEQLEDRGKYRLGLGLVRLAGSATVRLDLAQQSRPVCEELAAELAETINLAILAGDVAINIDQVLGPSTVTAHNWVGRRTPLHATSSGQVLLAYLSEDELESRLAGRLGRYTSRTVVETKAIRGRLRTVRADGYAACAGELETGLNAVAAPIFSYDGQVVAAVSATGPSFRLAEDRLPGAAAVVRAAAERISIRLGYVGEH